MRQCLVSVLAALFVVAAACGGDSTGPGSQLDLTVGFIPISQGLLDVGIPDRPGGALPGSPGSYRQITSSDSVRMRGDNGELVIAGIWGVASGLKLEESADACDGGGAGCHPFDSPPLVIVLPISGELVPISSGSLPASSYAGLVFELEDFEVDGPEDDEKADELAEGLDRIRMNPDFSDWPAEAAVLVTGTFTPDGGSAQEFRTYLTAEQLVDVPIGDPITLTEDDSGKDLQIRFAPAFWFVDRETGEVADLSQYDFGATSQVWDLVGDVGADPVEAFIDVALEGEGSALGPN